MLITLQRRPPVDPRKGKQNTVSHLRCFVYVDTIECLTTNQFVMLLLVISKFKCFIFSSRCLPIKGPVLGIRCLYI